MGLPVILGLDISKTRTGIAVGPVGSVPRTFSIEGKDGDVVEAMMRLGTWLLDWIKVEKPDWIFYEAAIDAAAFRPVIDWEAKTSRSTRDPNTTLVLAKMVGIVEFIAGMKSIRNRPVNVKTARVTFCGVGSGNLKGDEGKERVMQMAKLLGWPADNYDVTDAECVWHQGCVTVKPYEATIITPMLQSKAASNASAILAERAAKSAGRSARTRRQTVVDADGFFVEESIKAKGARGFTVRRGR